MEAVGSPQTAARFEDAFAHAPIATGILGRDGRLLHRNAMLAALLSGPAGEGVAALIDRHAPRVLERGRRTWRAERRVRSGARGWAWMHVHVARMGEAPGAVVQVVDVTAAHERVAVLQRLAERDPLTGLWNRRRFDQELTRQLARCRRHGDCATLAVFDVDGLKAVNDRLGHKGGDAVIVHVARSLEQRLRTSDSVARMGGDEFAVLLVGTCGRDALAAAEALSAAVAAEPVRVGREDVPVHVSAGFSVLTAETFDGDAAHVAADRALYDAKRGRRRREG